MPEENSDATLDGVHVDTLIKELMTIKILVIAKSEPCFLSSFLKRANKNKLQIDTHLHPGVEALISRIPINN